MTRPEVLVTFAQSLDGRIATRTGQSQWISGNETLQLAQELRRDNDAILVGIGTVLQDDPKLTCRLPGCSSPLRVVLDGSLRMPLASNIAATAGDIETIVFTDVDTLPSTRADILAERGIAVRGVPRSHELPGTTRPGLDLRMVLAELDARGVSSLMVEGGSAVITAFLSTGVVDRMVVVTAPLVIGEGVPAVGSLGVSALADALRFTTRDVRLLGQDVEWSLDVDRREAS